jgi:oligoribonuclease NrnB/cAMP/cGMP phosphodiesterase (DHH superfamily)
MKERLVIYHGPNCADGFTAAWVAHTVFGDSADYLEAAYGDAPPDVTGRDVLIVDFSYPRATLLEMAEKAKSLRVLDHHASAQRDLEGLDFCTFDMNECGATLTWKALRPSEPVPTLCLYVRDRDLWKWEMLASRSVNAWIGIHDRDFATWSLVAKALNEQEAVSVVRAGDAVLKHIDSYVESTAKNARRMVVECPGPTFFAVPVVNAPGMMASELIGHLAEGNEFAVGWHQMKDGRFKYSLRSRKGGADVSRIAERYSGAGHPGAAGFVSKLPPAGLFAEVEDA